MQAQKYSHLTFEKYPLLIRLAWLSVTLNPSRKMLN